MEVDELEDGEIRGDNNPGTVKTATFLVTRLGGNGKKGGVLNKARDIVIKNGDKCTVADVQNLIAAAFDHEFAASAVSDIVWGKPKTGKHSCSALVETLDEFQTMLATTRVKAKWAMFCTTMPTLAPQVKTVSSGSKRVTKSTVSSRRSPSPLPSSDQQHSQPQPNLQHREEWLQKLKDRWQDSDHPDRVVWTGTPSGEKWVLDDLRQNAWADALEKNVNLASLDNPPRLRLFNERENRPGAKKSTGGAASTAPIIHNNFSLNLDLDKILEKITTAASQNAFTPATTPATLAATTSTTSASTYANIFDLLSDLGRKEGVSDAFEGYARIFEDKQISLINIRFISTEQLISFGIPFGHANMILQVAKHSV
ncbi:hypothetical protein HDU79_007089 [Rhizoclosmatium sp. JEL0117]|nr:hypothetical protein HDU79_007089 [Rhizoclosmatium sp. JEL0117]